MAKQIKKPKKVEEPDLLPAMGLFTILIPMLLTMTAFSKLAIVEVNLPERSQMIMDNDVPPPPDEQALNLSLAIAMGTTLLGLLSAVPLLVIVGLLNMNSERLIQEMEEKGLKIINSLA